MFIINWNIGHGKAYVTKGQPNRKPYTSDPREAKTWKTRKNAERFLSLKDPGCEIEKYNG